MRVQGTLKKWDGQRGFGFLAPAGGGADVFVHITAFPRDGRSPIVGEVVTFETESGPGGKVRAVRVARQGDSAPSRKPAPPQAPRTASVPRILVAVAAMAAMAGYAFTHYAPRPEPVATPSQALVHPSSPPTAGFKCDGRTTCSQMTSCEEATFFLRHCPDTQMDGNGDGEPCEQQWCN